MTTPRKKPAAKTHRMPGDPGPAEEVAAMLRVDQAGEYGAVRIYKGQMAVLGDSAVAPTLQHMLDQEEHHLATFNRLVGDRRVRPTLLQPLWHVAGFALGAGTALMGEKAAMACTVAVEEAIDEHYAEQVARLDARADTEDAEPDLRDTMEKFRLEELEHRDTGLEHGAENAPAYPLLSAAIKTGSKLAIWLSSRI